MFFLSFLFKSVTSSHLIKVLGLAIVLTGAMSLIKYTDVKVTFMHKNGKNFRCNIN